MWIVFLGYCLKVARLYLKVGELLAEHGVVAEIFQHALPCRALGIVCHVESVCHGVSLLQSVVDDAASLDARNLHRTVGRYGVVEAAGMEVDVGTALDECHPHGILDLILLAKPSGRQILQHMLYVLVGAFPHYHRLDILCLDDIFLTVESVDNDFLGVGIGHFHTPGVGGAVLGDDSAVLLVGSILDNTIDFTSLKHQDERREKHKKRCPFHKSE